MATAPSPTRVPQQEIDDLIARCDPAEIVAALGMQVHRAGARLHAHCPNPTGHARGDKRPSFVVYASPQNPFHCFACGYHPSLIGLVMDLRNCHFREALLWICQITRLSLPSLEEDLQGLHLPPCPPRPPTTAPPSPPIVPAHIQAAAVAVFLRTLLEVVPTAGEEAEAYCSTRRAIPPDVVRATGGAYLIPSREAAAEVAARLRAHPSRDQLRQAGILVPMAHGDGERCAWWDATVLHVSVARGSRTPMYLRGRRHLQGAATPDDTTPKYVGQGSGEGVQIIPCGIPLLEAAARGRKPVLIVEGAFDAWAAQAMGCAAVAALTRPGFPHLASAERTTQGRMWGGLLDLLRRTAEVLIVPDSDATAASRHTGLVYARNLMRWLRLHQVRARVASLQELGAPTAKDCNDALQRGEMCQWPAYSRGRTP